jgi:hypothetical protein
MNWARGFLVLVSGRVGTEWVRDGSDRSKRQIMLPPQGSP